MADFVPVPSVMRINFMTTSSNYSGGWRIFVKYSTGPPTAADCTAVATGAADAWNSNLAAITPTPLSLVAVHVADLNSDLGFVGDWLGSHPGTLATTFVVPADACILVNHQIQRHYRGGKYRTYLPPATSAQMVSA